MASLTDFLSLKKSLLDLEIFYLTYDEPFKDQRWENIKKQIPSARRVDGVKGFDLAHKTCAEMSRSRRFLVIDGDNTLQPQFFNEKISLAHFFKSHVLSWSAVNSVNGLNYGNGGVKSWDKSTVLKMKTHEVSESPRSSSDFCFEVPYFQIPASLSVTHVNLTPFQAFRSGFREGVKMALIEGERPSQTQISSGLFDFIPRNNRFRLIVWMSVGADVSNGLWAILGARLGLMELIFGGEESVSSLHDYHWFNEYWSSEIAPKFKGNDLDCEITGYSWDTAKVFLEIERVGKSIKEILGHEIPLYSSRRSKKEKLIMKNPIREGYLFRE